jgi:predicted transcriptional regulator
MRKASPTAFRTGSLRAFADWTKQIVRDPSAARGVPKTWYEDEPTAQRAAADRVSAEAMVKLLSPGNLAMLAAIRRHKPQSVRELADLTGRTEASLSRTLKRFAALGIVAFRAGPRRTRIPALIARRVHLDIDLGGEASAVAVERRQ